MTTLLAMVRNLPLRWKIILPFALLSAATWMISAAILERNAEDLVLKQGRSAGSQAATAAARHLELRAMYLEREGIVLAVEAELIIGDRSATEAADAYRTQLVKAFTGRPLDEEPFVADLTKVQGPSGKTIIQYPLGILTRTSLEDEQLIASARGGESASGIVLTSGQHAAYVAAAVPIHTNDPRPIAFLMASEIDAEMLQELGLERQQHVFVVGPEGVLAAAGPTEDTEALAQVAGSTKDELVSVSGESFILSSAPIESAYTPGLRVVTALPTAPYAQEIWSARRLTWIVLGIGLAAFIGTAFAVTATLTRPLNALTLAAENLATGDLDARAPVGPRDEIGTLAVAFNAMGDELKRRDERLSQAVFDLRRLSETDALTGLLNHRAVNASLDREVARAQRHGLMFSVAIVDIDNFKLINDTYGHPAGDLVLHQVAETLAEHTRGGDIIGRHGGDEFMLILPETDTDEAVRVADKLRRTMQDHPFHTADDLRIPIRLSLGTASFPEDGRHANELLAHADANLYVSKRRGGNTVTRREDAEPHELTPIHELSMLDSLVVAVDNKDHYTHQHSADVTKLALALAKALGLGLDAQRILRVSGLLHDVGKIGVPDALLRKPGRLNSLEYELIKRHPAMGAALIQGIPDEETVRSAIVSHHEHWDGSGFPAGLRGEDIPLFGRILAVADAYSAMTSDRPYRKALTPDEALAQMAAASGTQFDPSMIDAFSRAIARDLQLGQHPSAQR